MKFSLFVNTFLTLFLKLCGLKGKVTSTSACFMVLLIKEHFPISAVCVLLLIFRLFPCLSSMLLVTCPDSFPCPFSGVCFEEGANARYLSTLRQGFLGRLILMIFKFSHFLLHQVKRDYLTFPVQISTCSSTFKNRTR